MKRSCTYYKKNKTIELVNILRPLTDGLTIKWGVTHPTIWTFIMALRKIQSGHYRQLEDGENPPKKQN